MYEYTKGKIEIFRDTNSDSLTFIEGGDNGAIASTFYQWRKKEICEANAARLASCWNACTCFENPESDIPKLIEALQIARVRLIYAGQYSNTVDEALALVKGD
jgi:hypothetical protein